MKPLNFQLLANIKEFSQSRVNFVLNIGLSAKDK